MTSWLGTSLLAEFGSLVTLRSKIDPRNFTEGNAKFSVQGIGIYVANGFCHRFELRDKCNANFNS